MESSENVARKSGWQPLSTRSSIWLLNKGDSLGDSSMLGKKAFSENGRGGDPRFFENITPGDGRSHLPRDKACGPMRREVVPGTSPMPREQMLLSQDQREPMFLQRRLQRKWLKAHAPESYNGSLSGMLVRTVGVNLVCRYLLHICTQFTKLSGTMRLIVFVR